MLRRDNLLGSTLASWDVPKHVVSPLNGGESTDYDKRRGCYVLVCARHVLKNLTLAGFVSISTPFWRRPTSMHRREFEVIAPASICTFVQKGRKHRGGPSPFAGVIAAALRVFECCRGPGEPTGRGVVMLSACFVLFERLPC